MVEKTKRWCNGVLEKQIGELIYKKKIIDGLIKIVNDLVRLNDEIHSS